MAMIRLCPIALLGLSRVLLGTNAALFHYGSYPTPGQKAGDIKAHTKAKLPSSSDKNSQSLNMFEESILIIQVSKDLPGYWILV